MMHGAYNVRKNRIICTSYKNQFRAETLSRIIALQQAEKMKQADKWDDSTQQSLQSFEELITNKLVKEKILRYYVYIMESDKLIKYKLLLRDFSFLPPWK